MHVDISAEPSSWSVVPLPGKACGADDLDLFLETGLFFCFHPRFNVCFKNYSNSKFDFDIDWFEEQNLSFFSATGAEQQLEGHNVLNFCTSFPEGSSSTGLG